ncbi:hypothetical protein CB0101_05010 [Synechococcus sp. CB0101]|uniref:hypothetical protein n=1 Tax=Synechococcus sp. CB0101 TaxID=232348 RepID=UPI0003150868|nr:hypothetical protein [Synechococcus sp. CB0101]QCH14372.1 hypothetical protein CB0101_05010 [Synechococcus sp. CB0101]
MPNPKTLATGTWLPIEQLAEQLVCGERTVDTLRSEGIFKAGEHYYAVGSGKKRPKFVYCLESCRAALLKRTAELEAERKATVEDAVTYDEEHLEELIREVRDGD